MKRYVSIILSLLLILITAGLGFTLMKSNQTISGESEQHKTELKELQLIKEKQTDEANMIKSDIIFAETNVTSYENKIKSNERMIEYLNKRLEQAEPWFEMNLAGENAGEITAGEKTVTNEEIIESIERTKQDPKFIKSYLYTKVLGVLKTYELTWNENWIGSIEQFILDKNHASLVLTVGAGASEFENLLSEVEKIEVTTDDNTMIEKAQTIKSHLSQAIQYRIYAMRNFVIIANSQTSSTITEFTGMEDVTENVTKADEELNTALELLDEF